MNNSGKVKLSLKTMLICGGLIIAPMAGAMISSIPLGDALLPVTLALILGLLIVWGSGWMAKSEVGRHILFPSTIISLSYFLLYVVMCLDLLFLRAYAGNSYLEAYLVEALLVAILGFVALVLGYVSPFGKTAALHYPSLPMKWQQSKVSFVIGILIIISGSILWYIIRDSGGINAYVFGLVSRRDLFFNRGYLLVLIGQINIALYLGFSYWLDEGRGGFLLSVTTMMAFVVSLLTGSRIALFGLSITLLFIYLSKGREIGKPTLIFLVAILALFAVLYGGFVREYLPYGVYINQTFDIHIGLWENMRVFWDRLAPLNFDSLYRLAFALERVPSEISFLNGKSFLGPIAYLIPRFLYPNKPDGIGMLFTMTFFPISYANGSGHTPSLLVDFYWNFGLPGVAAGMFLFGIFLRSAAEYALTHRGQTGPTVISAIIVSQIFGWLKSGSDTPTQAMAGYLIPWIAIAIFFNSQEK